MPAGVLATIGQTPGPKLVEPKLPAELAGQPALRQAQGLRYAPHCRGAAQLEILAPHADPAVQRVAGDRAIPGKQSQRALLAAVLGAALDDAAPRCALAVVDLAEVKHRSLEDLLPGTAPVLHDRPGAVQFAVFFALRASQKHDGSRS